MRIRSILPDFYRSEDIGTLDWHHRLVFIGLWSYVDDNGVGRDNPRLIASDLFPLDGDPTESLRRVSTALDALARGGQVRRYKVDGVAYLFVVQWDRYQRVQNPGKERYPRPTCNNVDSTEPLPTLSVDPPVILSPGEGEKGRRGEGEKGKQASPAANAAPERIATTNAYERTGKALKFIAVEGIAKWAIHTRGADPQTVEDAIVGIYELGKPVTKSVMGQYLDGHIGRARSTDHARDILAAELSATRQIGASR